MRTVKTMEDLRGRKQVDIEGIRNVVPYIIEHAKTLVPSFDKSWEFGDGYETWFPMFTQDAINFYKACEDEKWITTIEIDAFYGSYWSDEVHRYKMLWYRGELKAINFMVGDTTRSRTLWFKKGDRAKIIAELMANFPADPHEMDLEEIYTEETGEQISQSQYLQFVKFDGDLWAINGQPNHGSLLGRGRNDASMRVLEFVSMPILDETTETVMLDHGPCKRHIDNNAIGYNIHVLEDGTVLKCAEEWARKKYDIGEEEYVRIEKVMDLPKVEQSTSESEPETEA